MGKRKKRFFINDTTVRARRLLRLPDTKPTKSLEGNISRDMARAVYRTTLSTVECADYFDLAESTVRRIRMKDQRRQDTRYLHLGCPVGQTKHKSKTRLTREQVKEIYTSSESVSQMAKKFNVSRHAVRLLRAGVRRGDITKNYKRAIVTAAHARSLNAAKIILAYQSDGTVQEISTALDVSLSSVDVIRHRLRHTKVTENLGMPGGHGPVTLKRLREQVRSKSKKTSDAIKKAHKAMISRTTNSEDPSYKKIGGLGLRVSDSWLTLKTFTKWCHSQPVDIGKSGTDLVRKDLEKGYSAGNCLIS